MYYPQGFLLSEIKRLQRAHPREELPEIIAAYVEARYYPRVMCVEEIRDIQEKEGAVLSDEQLWNKIVAAVSQHSQMSWEVISSRSRKKETVAARRLIIFLACLRTKFTTTSIGEKFGFDHTSVIYSRDAIYDSIDTDADLRETIEFLNSLI